MSKEKISVKSNVFVGDKEIIIVITLCLFKESLYVQERSEHLWSWQLPIFLLSAPLFCSPIELMRKTKTETHLSVPGISQPSVSFGSFWKQADPEIHNAFIFK